MITVPPPAKASLTPAQAPSLPAGMWLDLLGLPWRKDARGPDAYDCVGLLLEIERRLGYPVPAYASELSELSLAMLRWEPVETPIPGDGILIRSADPRWHIGVVCGGGYMLHSREGAGVVRERYNSLPWLNRIEGFYRWKQVLP
jgi:cell wall-associated NlpC family hydrolase